MHSTAWDLVRDAARGDNAARGEVARVYLPAVASYFRARWRSSRLSSLVDDAVQDVFVDLLRTGGLLDRADPARGRFRSLIYGAARVAALRHEERAFGTDARVECRSDSELASLLPPEEELHRTFDRAWATSLIGEARTRMMLAAQRAGEREAKRVELLQLRFTEDLPIRDIAARWAVDAAWLHHEYAIARDEFRAALLDVVQRQGGVTGSDADAECREILAALG